MTEPATRQFDVDYEEMVHLKDGTRVLLRLIRPDDKERLLDALGRMSPESRYRRFFAARDSLTKHELSYLTELDYERHFAIGAGIIHDDGHEELRDGIGVGRFICDQDDPTRAEVAVAVVDAFHGHGLGRVLFKRLVVAGRERGVERFHVSILSENDAMLGLLKSIFPEHYLRIEEGVVIVECPLPEVALDRPDERPDGAVYHVLSMAAEGLLNVIRSARSWPVPPDLTDGLLRSELSTPSKIIKDKK